ncbi:MAG: hypothetical protein KDB00_17485, partial [Planctomycetales bacterium]|nr:hypothetical protein [Planctomycetales bacterium]
MYRFLRLLLLVTLATVAGHATALDADPVAQASVYLDQGNHSPQGRAGEASDSVPRIVSRQSTAMSAQAI